MIIVKLMGGFANQLFQYSTGRALAETRGEELLLDLSYLNADAKGAYTKRNYELNQIHVHAKIADEELLGKFSNERLIDKLLNKTGLKSHQIFNEFQSNYISEINNLSENVLLNGYWQSEKYFEKIRAKLLSEIIPNYDFTNQGKVYLEKINSSPSVGIHVRRGDYIQLKQAANFHGNCDMNYYLNAIKLMNEKYSDANYFTFSDDIDWCKKQFSDLNNVFFIEAEQNKNSSQDMFIMSKCKHQIIANSSYSWWAAWLNQFNEKTVIAPKKWFNDGSINISDLIPNNWISI